MSAQSLPASAGGPQDAVSLEAECQRLSEELSRLSRLLEGIEAEREFLLLHGQGLEREVRRLIHEQAEAARLVQEAAAVPQARVEALEAALAHADEQATAQMTRIEALDTALAHAREVAATQEARIASREVALMHLEGLYRAVVNSLSWRITAPCRAVGLAVRALFRR